VTRKLGCVPDVPDDRDFLFAAHPVAASPIVDFATIDQVNIAPKNQLGTSSCCGNGTAQGARLASIKAGHDCPDLSARFLYRAALNIDGTNVDEGTQVRSAVKALMQLGACPESDMPMSEAHILDQPSFHAERDAFDRRGVRGYHRIASGDIDGVKRALAAGFGGVGGWRVTQAFCSTDGKHVIDAQIAPFAGGHCMTVVAYGSSEKLAKLYPGFHPDKHYDCLFVILGSWGGDVPASGEPPTWYGFNGRIIVTPAFIAQVTDMWALDTGGGL
jgi:hypothetical protein